MPQRINLDTPDITIIIGVLLKRAIYNICQEDSQYENPSHLVRSVLSDFVIKWTTDHVDKKTP